ncbi:MAG: sensor histidine kinase [Solirubrobacteraceae bacterium]
MIRDMIPGAGAINRRDIAIATVLSLLGIVMMLGNVDDKTIRASPAIIPLFLVVTLPVLWRRGAPLAALAATIAALLLHITLFGTVVRCGVVFPLAFVLVFAAGARLPRRDALIGLALGLAVVIVMTLADHSVDAPSLAFIGPLTVGVWWTGRITRSRGTIVSELETRTAELREARDERARLEVATDRTRLSAELDELLHRRLGELARLAEGASGDANPAATRGRLEEIERESRHTLEQMRDVVGVLRHDTANTSTAPQPTLTHLEALLTRAKGTDARLRVEGNPRALPAGVELSAYRVVEHLLDAMDDSTDVEVCVRFRDDALELAVSGPARRHGETEAAIARARERIALHRGSLEASTHAGHAEAVAHLPVLAGA